MTVEKYGELGRDGNKPNTGYIGVHMTLDNNNEVTYYDIIDKILHRVSKDCTTRNPNKNEVGE